MQTHAPEHDAPTPRSRRPLPPRPHAAVQALAAICLLAAGVVPPAHADALAAPGMYGQLGAAGSSSRTRTAAIGTTAPIGWHGTLASVPVGAYWDVYAKYLDAYGDAGRSTTMFGVTPTFRVPIGAEGSPWFADAGIGVAYTTRLYVSNAKAFSTRWNFGSHIALGYAFGPARNQEISLRLQHFSNAGLQHPNPGENFVQLRYGHSF